MPFLAGTPFLAADRALTDCRLFLLPDEIFRHMLTAYPSFSQKILETMAQRVQILRSIATQREKLNSLSTLAAGLAHELNNPAATARRAAVTLYEETLKAQKTAMREVDVREGLESALTILAHKLKKGVEREHAEGLPRIRAHDGELNQAWTNIVDNAVDAMGGHGNLKVKTSGEDGYVLVEIIDAGHPAGGEGQNLRAVLHHKGDRQGNRPETRHRPANNLGTRR